MFPICHQKPWFRIRIGIQPKMLDPESMNPNRKPCSYKALSLPILKVLPETLFWEFFAAFGMPPSTDKNCSGSRLMLKLF
jgi:hypothetical protein